MWQELVLEDVFHHIIGLFFGEGFDVVDGSIAGIDRMRGIHGSIETVDHEFRLRGFKIAEDTLCDLFIGGETESSKEDHDWYDVSNIGKSNDDFEVA